MPLAAQTPAAARLDVEALRRRFPVTERWVYLNHAGIGPMPREAVDRVRAAAALTAETGDRGWPERNDEHERVRSLAARLFGARHPHEVAFVGNTSEGLSIVAQGLDWRPGDNVVGPEPEFPSNVYPWLALERRGVEYRRVPERGGQVLLDDLLAAVDRRTRVLAVSWIEYASGQRLDLALLAEACRRRGVLLVADVIQGLGVLRFDAPDLGVDVAVAAAHKWLLGPEGIGLLYLADRVVEGIAPTRHGWRSVEGRYEWDTVDPTPAQGALRHEAGTHNTLALHALGAALDLRFEIGPAAIEERALALADRAAAGLPTVGFEVVSPRALPGQRSAIVVGRHPRRPAAELAEALVERGLVVAPRAGRLRVSPHVYNTEDEIDRLLAELADLAR